MIPCTQIYSALCDYNALVASLSRHEGVHEPAELAGEIQNALIWGDYRHGHYGSDASSAIEAHVAGVIAASEAMLFHAYRPAQVDSCFVSAVTAPVEALCSAATPAIVSAAVLSRSGCQRTAEVIEGIALAHTNTPLTGKNEAFSGNNAQLGGNNKVLSGNGCGSLPSSERASPLFAMSVLALAEDAIMSPTVTYVRRGADAFFLSNDSFACHDSAWNFVRLFGGEMVTLPAG